MDLAVVVIGSMRGRTLPLGVAGVTGVKGAVAILDSAWNFLNAEEGC
jgi:hypothetical protein